MSYIFPLTGAAVSTEAQELGAPPIILKAVSESLTGQTVYSLAVDKSGALYAAAAEGIFKSEDEGGKWLKLSSPQSTVALESLAVDPNAPSVLYAGTGEDTGGLFKSTDGGETWVDIAAALPDQFVTSLTAAPADPTAIYAGTASGGIYRSDDAGATWNALSFNAGATDVRGIVADPVNPNSIYAITKHSGAYRSADGGENWTVLNEPVSGNSISSLAIYPARPATIYIGLARGNGIYASDDGGESWNPVSAEPRDVSISALAIAPAGDALYAATPDGVLKMSTGKSQDDQQNIVTAPSACVTMQISSGQTISGSLTSDDCTSLTRANRFADRFVFNGTAGQRADILITAANYDSFLILYGPTGNVLAQADNSGQGGEWISVTLTVGGTHTIEVTSDSSRVLGNYTESLRGS
ncbi:MAG: hypothetical protein L0229_30355, partial [Blastocatellia bacterium]|nr:hypothetical protein [Blastocatellia bacterium]